jgi:GNAT superfamily N-acetyltransferase
MKTAFKVREATLEDLAILVRYNAELARETEGRVLSVSTLEKGVRHVLSDPQKGRYFVAECLEGVVGQTLVTYEWSDWRDGWIWWLQSVFVAAGWRRQGVFRALYEHIVQEATRQRAVGLRVYVREENQLARTVYEQLSLRPAGYVVYERTLPPG